MGAVSGSTNGPPRSIEILAPQIEPGAAPPGGGALRKPARPDAARAMTNLVDRLLGEVVMRHAPGRRTLDLGRGATRVSEWVEPLASTHTVIDAIDLGRSGDVRVPFPDASFDLVYSLRTLSHLGRDDETSRQAAASTLAEIGRLTRPDGTALVQFENATSLWGLYHGIRNPLTAVERGPLVIASERGITRFDTLGRFKRMLPPTLHISRVHGARIFTLVPTVLRLPIIRSLFESAEWFGRDRTLLAGLGAHILVELRRVAV